MYHACRATNAILKQGDVILRAILLIALLVATLSSTGSIATPLTFKEEIVVTVDSTNLRFSPSSVTITEGDSVRFFWSGQLLAHNAVADDGLFDSGDPETSVDYTFIFEIGTNGTHTYVCEPHEAFGMVGSIIVQPAPPDDSAEPEPDPVTIDLSQPSDSWIPFFGLEIVALILIVALIYQYGRTRGIAETEFISKHIEEKVEE